MLPYNSGLLLLLLLLLHHLHLVLCRSVGQQLHVLGGLHHVVRIGRSSVVVHGERMREGREGAVHSGEHDLLSVDLLMLLYLLLLDHLASSMLPGCHQGAAAVAAVPDRVVELALDTESAEAGPHEILARTLPRPLRKLPGHLGAPLVEEPFLQLVLGGVVIDAPEPVHTLLVEGKQLRANS